MGMLGLTILLGVIFVILMALKSPLALFICVAPVILPFIARRAQMKKQQELIDAVRELKANQSGGKDG